MVSPSTTHRNASRAQSEGPRQGGVSSKRGQGQYKGIKAGVLHLASLQRGSLILAQIATTLLQERLPWVTIVLYPTASESWGVHARYALLGTRSAGGGRRPGDRLGDVPIGPPLALAASRGPGGLTRESPPRPVNDERGAG